MTGEEGADRPMGDDAMVDRGAGGHSPADHSVGDRSPAEVAQRLEATVRGHVQGVGFRWFVQRIADRLGVAGWVANRPDRSVEVVAEGAQAALETLLTALHEGPPSAHVDRVEHHLGPARGEPAGFRIRSGSHPGD